MDYRPMFIRIQVDGQNLSIPIYANPLFPVELFKNTPCSPDVFLALYTPNKNFY